MSQDEHGSADSTDAAQTGSAQGSRQLQSFSISKRVFTSLLHEDWGISPFPTSKCFKWLWLSMYRQWHYYCILQLIMYDQLWVWWWWSQVMQSCTGASFCFNHHFSFNTGYDLTNGWPLGKCGPSRPAVSRNWSHCKDFNSICHSNFQPRCFDIICIIFIPCPAWLCARDGGHGVARWFGSETKSFQSAK